MMEDTYYYYYRDKDNKPRVTVCLIRANGDVARGVAICSLKDNPCKKTGRKIARDRAIYAMKSLSNNCMLQRPDAINAAYETEYRIKDFTFSKSSYCPPLTDLERKILGV